MPSSAAHSAAIGGLACSAMYAYTNARMSQASASLACPLYNIFMSRRNATMARKHTRSRQQGARSPVRYRSGDYMITIEDTLAYHRTHHAPGYVPRKLAAERASSTTEADAPAVG